MIRKLISLLLLYSISFNATAKQRVLVPIELPAIEYTKTITFYYKEETNQLIQRNQYRYQEPGNQTAGQRTEDIFYNMEDIFDSAEDLGIDKDYIFMPVQMPDENQSENQPGDRIKLNKAFLPNQSGVRSKTDEYGMQKSGVNDPTDPRNFVEEINEESQDYLEKNEDSRIKISDLAIEPYKTTLPIKRNKTQQTKETETDSSATQRYITGQRQLKNSLDRQQSSSQAKNAEKRRENRRKQRKFDSEMANLKDKAEQESFNNKVDLLNLLIKSQNALSNKNSQQKVKKEGTAKLIGIKKKNGKEYFEYEVDENFGENYQIKTKDSKFRPKLKGLQKKIDNFDPSSVKEQRLKNTAYSSMIVADQESLLGNKETAELAYEIGSEIADIALSMTPGVSVYKDLYEAIWGISLVTNRRLSIIDRSFNLLGVVTLGSSNMIRVGAKATLGVIGKIAKNLVLITKVPNTRFASTFSNAKDLLKIAKEKSIKNLDQFNNFKNEFKNFTNEIKDSLPRLLSKEKIQLYSSARKLGLKAKEEFQLFTKLAGNNRGSVGFIDDFAESTKSVWNRLGNKGPNWTGSNIPKHFEVTVGSEKFFVNPNATKHMNEYVSSYFRSTTHSAPVHSQMLLNSFEGSVKSAVKSGNWKKSMETGEVIIQDGWELVFKKQRAGETLPVIKHARRVN